MQPDNKPTVGFIGIGIMGASMAANLQKAGYKIVVHDSRREVAEQHIKAGARWADTPAALTSDCDVVLSCLPSVPVIDEVALGPNGILSTIRPEQAYFELSTSSPECVRRLHHGFSEKGAFMLDAPVSGGAVGAKRGRLAIWVGGHKPSFERYQSMLQAMGDQVVHVGAIGTGLVTKLVNNCAAQATQAAIAEVFVLGVKAGADPLSLWEALRQGAAGRRRTFDGLIDEFLPARYDPPNSALRIVHKDLLTATELARELDVPMRITSLTLSDVQEAMLRGWSERDSRSVMLLPQERVGVVIKSDPSAIEEVLRRDPVAPSDSKRGTAK